MVSDSIPDPSVLTRVDLDPPDPEPEECLPPGETTIASAPLSPGWIAVTEREYLSYHPDRDPAVVRTPRRNVTGIAVRRAGGRSLFGYAPAGILYALATFVFGVGFLMVSPTDFIAVPDAPGAGQLDLVLETLGWAMSVLGAVLLFSGILVGLGVLTVVGHWLFARDVALVLERGSAEPIECPTTRQTGMRAARTIEDALE